MSLEQAGAAIVEDIVGDFIGAVFGSNKEKDLKAKRKAQEEQRRQEEERRLS
ncbi:hypothetical protein ACFL2T_02395 [Elusimicrobiota bacterium]